ncbi:hypothetical protein [Diaphorobacter ruginosibacter]|uniref:hypothetical protein n=1 Tax=Diaphorobacter ruginosibacter TaxID=1715720 RepID=UPI003340E287
MSATQGPFKHHLHPPVVQFSARRSAWAGYLIAMLAVTGLAVLGAWLAQTADHPLAGARLGVAAGLWLSATSGALHWWWTNPAAMLHWNGQQWTMAGAGGDALPVELEVLMDFQSYLLIQAWSQGRVRSRSWFLLERKTDPQSWPALRRAVYFRAHADLPFAGGPAH